MVMSDRSVAEKVRPLARRLDLESQLEQYGAQRWLGAQDQRPILHLDDVSKIPFVQDVAGVEEYQHRARVRARTGDLFVAVTDPSDGYEDYCRDTLRLGSPRFVRAPSGQHGYAVAEACFSDPPFGTLVERARGADGLSIHAYMAIGEVWRLAARVAEVSGTRVEVVGPPPPVLWIANDKAALSEIVVRVLSEDWIVETHAANEQEAMAKRLQRLAHKAPSVGLKRARCASGLGNAVYEAEPLRRLDFEGVLGEVEAFLRRTEWAGDEEVLVVAWERTDCSPSSQLWIPPSTLGAPQVEGVYEQLLEGDNRIFLGSRPSTLPEPVNRRIGEASLVVAEALQALGYVGRCSFDFILLGDPAGEFSLKFTECNGRWGGTSTPMHLVDRVVDGPRPPYRAQDFMHEGLVGLGFHELLARLDGEIYDPATGDGSYILYNVGPLARTGKFDVVAIGSTPTEAERLIEEDLPRRLGL
jgi:hypothetical protein